MDEDNRTPEQKAEDRRLSAARIEHLITKVGLTQEHAELVEDMSYNAVHKALESFNVALAPVPPELEQITRLIALQMIYANIGFAFQEIGVIDHGHDDDAGSMEGSAGAGSESDSVH